MKIRMQFAGLIALAAACAAAPSLASAPDSGVTKLPAKTPDAAVTAPPAGSVAAPVVSQQMHDDIVTLLGITFAPRMDEMISLMTKVYLGQLRAKYNTISPAVADEITQTVEKAMNTPDRVSALEEDLVPVYAQDYTDEEIRQLIAFSKTSAGAKMFAGTPNKKEMAGAMQQWAMGVMTPVLLMDTANILKAHNITINSDGTSGSNP